MSDTPARHCTHCGGAYVHSEYCKVLMRQQIESLTMRIATLEKLIVEMQSRTGIGRPGGRRKDGGGS